MTNRKPTREELERERRKSTRVVFFVFAILIAVMLFIIVKVVKEDLQRENLALKEQLASQMGNIDNQTYIIKFECWTDMFGKLTYEETFVSKENYQRALDYANKYDCEILP